MPRGVVWDEIVRLGERIEEARARGIAATFLWYRYGFCMFYIDFVRYGDDRQVIYFITHLTRECVVLKKGKIFY